MADQTNIELAYAAGIIDGEGTICIVHRNKGYYELTVAVRMCDFSVPVWLLAKFGGYYDSRKPKELNYRDYYRWCISHNKALEFLSLVLPYLKTKRVQAEVAIEFQQLWTKYKPYRQSRRPKVMIEAQEILAAKCKELKHG